MNLEIVIDDDMPSHAIYLTVNGDDVRVQVSSRVEAAAVAALAPHIGLAIAEYLDGIEATS